MRPLTVAVAFVVCVTPAFVDRTPAAPLDWKQVPADASWVAHADVDALWGMTLVKKGWEKQVQTRKDAESRLAALREWIGMDITKDVHGVTAYGKDFNEQSAVLIVHATVNQKLLLDAVEKAPDHQVAKYRSYDIHSWTVAQRGRNRTVAAAFFKPEVIVVAAGAKQIEPALDVLSGAAPGAGSDSPLAGSAAPGTALVARATGLSGANLPNRLPMGKQLESLRLAAGEDRGEVFLRVEAGLADAEAAGQAKAGLDRLLFMASQFIQDDPAAKRLIDALRVTAAGKTLTLAWSAPADAVWDTLQKYAGRAAGMGARKRIATPQE